MSKEKEYWKHPTERELPKEESEPTRLSDEEPLEAQATGGAGQGGSSPTSSPGAYTVDPSSLGGGSTLGPASGDLAGASVRGDSSIDELTVADASDPTLGLTNIGTVPPEDWAANTGPTVTGEEGREGATRKLADRSSSLNPRERVPDRTKEGAGRKG